MALRGMGVVGALALAALSSVASAQVVTRDIYYTRFGVANPGESNVKRVTASYNRATHALSLNTITNIAITEGADGINFAPDGDLLVGGQGSGKLFRINRTTLAQTFQPTGLPGAFHVKVDPTGSQAYTAGLPGMLATVPLSPFAPGTPHALSGDDTSITDIVWAAGRVFYTASDPAGHGNFGIIDLGTFTTQRVLTNVDYAHGIQYDPFTGHVILFGEHLIAQIDPAPLVPTIVSVADFTATYPTLDLDQGAVDGTGLIYAASNTGSLFVMDYSGTHQVATSTGTASVQFLDTFLDDIAPILGAGVTPCCEIGSGAFDLHDAQQSQLPGLSTVPFDYRVADDFYLLPDRIYRITSMEATMITDSTILPKAQLELYEDCNGLPTLTPFRTELQATSIVDTGTTYQGKRVLTVTFNFTDLWLKGGKSYWVSFIGKGLSDPNEVWYWGTAGFGVPPRVQGRPGVFRSAINGLPNWVSIDGQGCPNCIGCTDFAFCVHGSSCKILNDNGTYATAANSGTLSLASSTITFAQTADDFVIPPCSSGRLCYIEAYIASNCAQARVALYENSCFVADHIQQTDGGNIPAGLTPFAVLTPNRIVNTGQMITINGQSLPILCLQFWDVGLSLVDGRTYWLSAYGLGTGSSGQIAYFLFNQDCHRQCLIRWTQGAIYGPSVQASPYHWVHGSLIYGVPHDYAFMVAVDDGLVPFANGANPQPCGADYNNSGELTVQDVFDYLSAWFTGCP